ncbi:polysaccharide pyruvyl transferase family protein [Cognataquiflexum aquatile]|uniref:polysaccharide pyruvyl transferase family protein n=1 Tax=Cognataquiflexum aquatile TaxID=2249427 RepID=UPI000DE96DBA|nr:polysaccharide pyruvyl transferase family protein [Cognataquiflexum aquatile]
MKIGILTLPLHTNYGGILQAYALKTVLEQMGHDAYLIDVRLTQQSMLKVFKNKIKEFIFRDKALLKSSFSRKIKFQAYTKFTKLFIDKHFKNKTHTMSKIHQLEDEIKKYKFDAFVVGSDQIWNPKYFKNIEIAFLSFVNDEKILKISYAPSFGSDTWSFSPIQENNCKTLIQNFDAVSVREDSGVQLCEKYFGAKAKWVLDPTMLLKAEEYLKLIPKSFTTKSGKMFTYILDKTEDKAKMISYIGSQKNLEAYELQTIEGYGPISLEMGTKASVEEWINSFSEAKFVVTDSFHGTVFSILFNKPFYSVINFKRGATRFQSLLKAFDLEDRLLGSFSDLESKDITNQIDWENVNKKLEGKRTDSFLFLKESLKKRNS